MKTNYVSISNAIQDFVQDSGLEHEEIKPHLLTKWATDCVRWMISDEQLTHRIIILQVENSRAELPIDFGILAQAAAKPDMYKPCDCNEDPDCCDEFGKPKHRRRSKSRREDIVQWVQGTLEKDCELEINLVCPKCHQSGCDCETPHVQVDVDRTWEMAHPEIYYRHFTTIGRFGYGAGEWSSYYTPDFKLMRYASNDFFNIKNILGDCPNVDCQGCTNEFYINMPYIEVDFERGEILLSYLGKLLDENGDYMIPDHPDVHAAITAHLTHKWYWRKYLKDRDPLSRAIAQEAKIEREQSISYARSYLETPSFLDFKNWIENSYYKRVPNYHHSETVNKITEGERSKYSRLLFGGRKKY